MAYLFTVFLRARVLISNKIIATLDEAFNLIGETPIKTSTPLHDIFMERFRRELADIESAEARRLFILVKTSDAIHRRIGEYSALIKAAEITSHHAVRVLLESCLADNASRSSKRCGASCWKPCIQSR